MDDNKQTLDWDAVYWEFMPRVYNYFRYQVGDSLVAEDLTATTFVKIWKARRDYKPNRGALSTWLFTIARNTGKDYFRRERMSLPLETMQLPVSDKRPVEDLLLNAQDSARLLELLEQISPKERELIALKYGLGMTNRAVAKLLDMNESTVGSTLYRTVKWLRAAWEVKTHE